jgi:4-hydroxy-tetrahydrodipicolinate reductase
MLRVIINGCYGRMGQAVNALAAAREDVRVVAGVDAAAKGKTTAGGAAGAGAKKSSGAEELTVTYPVFPSLGACDVEADALIDFSAVEALPGLLAEAVRRRIALVLATTGYTEAEMEQIRRAAEKIPILQSANMSLGVNLLSELAAKAAALLAEQFDIEIIEKHHNQKKDAPSGTALVLATAINEVLLSARTLVYGRYGREATRQKSELGIHAVRGGTIVGEHTVLFAGKDEVFELTHSAASRQVFAAGALRAAFYLQGKAPKLFTMKDMIAAQTTVTNLYTSGEEALVTVLHLHDDPHLITRIFQRLGEADINIDMISQTAPEDGMVNISFTLLRKDVEQAVSLLESFKQAHPRLRVAVLREIFKITVEGAGMERQSGVAAEVFAVMAKEGIQIRTITTSETKISYCIDSAASTRAVAAIRRVFGL